MKLYNVSFDLNNTNELLVPTIPHTAGPEEDKTSRRVCLADSVAHCMLAISTEYRNIAVGSKFILKTVEIEPDKFLITPKQLIKYKKVPDALENNEYWYLYPIRCKSVYLCEITDFDSEIDLAWTCIKPEQCRDIVKKHTGLDFKRCKTSKGIYKSFCKYAHERQLWSMMDDVWDELAELPWAQGRKMNKLNYKVIKTYK